MEEARSILKEHSHAKCYLTRFDTTQNKSFLTVQTDRKSVTNFAIETTYNISGISHRLKGASQVFQNIPDLLEFYENNSVTSAVHKIGVGVQVKKFQDININICIGEKKVSPQYYSLC